jgi:ceramide glucosyltransferase
VGPLAAFAGLLSAVGIAHVLGGLMLIRRFAAAGPKPAEGLPPMTVLRPLYRDEPLLEDALASACTQDYPCFQVVFGVQDPADTALPVAQRVRARFPDRDVLVRRDDTADGANRKVANLMNMLPAARHDVIVIADSDVHAPRAYLTRLAEALGRPGVGMATTLYAGVPANRSLAAKLGADWITHTFLPGALLGRAFGRQDALGATMALRRETLAAVGGFEALRNDLADDQVLGRRVKALGLRIALAQVVVGTSVPESRIGALFSHELRWARTIRSIVPLEFAASGLQYPLAWALLSVLLAGAAWWSLLLFVVAWAARAWAARQIDAALGLSGRIPPSPLWLPPLRDIMSVAVLVASYAGQRVVWRGQVMRAGPLETERS